MLLLSAVFYRQFFKRFYDIVCSLLALIVFSPLFLILIIIGAIKMGGNPFYTQARPGKNEKIFKLIKFRSMTNKKDENGELLPDEIRLTTYGKFLRKTSLDELPEAINILLGHMSIIGPRPLLVQYLERYNEEQKQRHNVRPGLSGLAQVNGRNAISWEQKFFFDVKYVNTYTFFGDIKILFQTVFKAFVKAEGISQEDNATMQEFMGSLE
ncbi:MAG: sugar transferase [Bacillota bacterium]